VNEEVLVELPTSAASVRLATHVRGSVLSGSLRSLRQRQLEPAYFAALEPALHERVRGLVAAEWVPAELAVAHYTACDRLALSADVIESIGNETGTFLNGAYVQVLMRMAREGGATPVGIFARIERVRERLWRGSSFRVVQTGPKDLRVEWHGQPCAGVAYFRSAFAAYVSIVVRPFVRSIYVREGRPLTDSMLTYGVSWA
jgi:hypothetical protein